MAVATRALALSRPVIAGLMLLNGLYALLILALLVFSFLLSGWPERPLGAELVRAYPNVGTGLRAIVLVALVAAALTHDVLRRLRAIVASVREGGAFTTANAAHLEAIAWRVLGLEGLRIVVAITSAAVWEPGRVDAFSFAPWLAILLLFVLSGVFAHGAQMRAELEGTV